MSIFLGAIKTGKHKLWKIIYKNGGNYDHEIVLDDLDEGAIIIENRWRKKNSKKVFVQTQFYGYNTKK